MLVHLNLNLIKQGVREGLKLSSGPSGLSPLCPDISGHLVNNFSLPFEKHRGGVGWGQKLGHRFKIETEKNFHLAIESE